ncbi:MAG: hypothetical protein LWX54_17340, partial [Deltaproteobacteria bacterium]|nr:hypothetical protein [Deltaproteobacteria bacterium]
MSNITGINATLPMITPEIIGSPWISQSFAHEWFKDALHETQNACGYNSTRREIIFAVAFAESYLFEWLRDDIFKENYNKLSTYYHLFYNQSPIKKWKEIPKKLHIDGLIPSIPKIENIKQEWDEFDKVVKYRNGLSHGASSIPKNLSLLSEVGPTPPLGELHKKK